MDISRPRIPAPPSPAIMQRYDLERDINPPTLNNHLGAYDDIPEDDRILDLKEFDHIPHGKKYVFVTVREQIGTAYEKDSVPAEGAFSRRYRPDTEIVDETKKYHLVWQVRPGTHDLIYKVPFAQGQYGLYRLAFRLEAIRAPCPCENLAEMATLMRRKH